MFLIDSAKAVLGVFLALTHSNLAILAPCRFGVAVFDKISTLINPSGLWMLATLNLGSKETPNSTCFGLDALVLVFFGFFCFGKIFEISGYIRNFYIEISKSVTILIAQIDKQLPEEIVKLVLRGISAMELIDVFPV